jgi:ATP-dependent DNA helicase RecG
MRDDPAIEEVLVNAMYHRGYDQREPVEVRVEPDGIAVVSYPGPDASIRLETLNSEKIVSRRYRNRRIGEFLKELELTEGRCTGIPKIRRAMAHNGSPAPRFSTDEGRTYFLAELPVHPELPGVGQAHDEVHEKGHDEVHEKGHDEVLNESEQRLLAAMAAGPKSRAEMAAALGMKTRRSGHLSRVTERLRRLGLAEFTIPDKPQSRNQKMRITEAGRAWLARTR